MHFVQHPRFRIKCVIYLPRGINLPFPDHHELNSSVTVGCNGRSKCNLLVYSHVSHLLIFNSQIPRKKRGNSASRLKRKSQGTSNGLDGKTYAWVHDVVLRSDSVVSAPYRRLYACTTSKALCSWNAQSRLCFCPTLTGLAGSLHKGDLCSGDSQPALSAR